MTVTVVTGASSGIGRSLARRLGARGDPVALLARRKDALDFVAAGIVEAGGSAIALPCDVTDATQVASAVREAEAALGPVERLVANAGGGAPTFVDEFRAADVAAMLDLNVLGTARCIEAVLPGMLERRRGHLIAISSLAASRGLPTAAGYTAAKAALDNLMESLRIDLRGRGVDVTLISPGPVRIRAHSKKPHAYSIALDDALDRMLAAIDARDAQLRFPSLVSNAARVGRWLPAWLYDRLLAGRGRKPSPSAD